MSPRVNRLVTSNYFISMCSLGQTIEKKLGCQNFRMSSMPAWPKIIYLEILKNA